MSLFCIVAISDININAAISQCKVEIAQYAKRSEIGLQFEHFYLEPFLFKYNTSRHIIFNLSDNDLTTNCEKLLCPDWCNVQGNESRATLNMRLSEIVNLLEFSYEQAKDVPTIHIRISK